LADFITTLIAPLIVIAISVATALRYRRLSNKYKQLYEKTISKPVQTLQPPTPKPHTSQKAIDARTRLEAYLEIRKEIFLRDHSKCRECGFQNHLQVHHIIPRSKGGSDDPSNLITLCNRCHQSKHGFGKQHNKRARHSKRNRKKKFKNYIKENARRVQAVDYPVQSLEDVHPFREDLSDDAVEKRNELYRKWEQNQLNQPQKS
jgi:5-methylcytosine-specific restriction endonuclease McrA